MQCFVSASEAYYTMKQVTPNASTKYRSTLQEEIEMLSDIKHVNVVKIFGIVQDPLGVLFRWEAFHFVATDQTTIRIYNLEQFLWHNKPAYNYQIA